MKQAPPINSAHQPLRRRASMSATSVEVGPGSRLAPPIRSKSSCSVTQPLRTTSSERMKARWAAGPPKAVSPRRRYDLATSLRVAGSTGGLGSRFSRGALIGICLVRLVRRPVAARATT